MKKYKMKKAVNGLQDIAVPEQGSFSNVLSSTSSLASAGSQFGPWGAAAGGLLGLGAGLLNKKKQDAAYKSAKSINADNKMNRSFAGDETTINQASQRFSKGTKMIEIEGKKTPEIHTDKSFNVKNLGTTPHSKGGDKVVAEEGDIVFNTQNSLAKYNKIAKAIDTGDHATLKKEKNKLPEDSGTKNQTGNRGVKKQRDYMMEEEEREAKGLPKPSYMVRPTPPVSNKRPYGAARTNSVTGYELPNSADQRRNLAQPKVTGNLDMRPQEGAFNVPTKPRNYVAINPAYEGYKLPGKVFNDPVKKKTTIPKSGKKVTPSTPISTVNPLDAIKFTPGQETEPDLSALKNSRTLDQVAESGKSFSNKQKNVASTTDDATSITPNTFANKANTALQFAGVANNLFQGLKGEKPIDESYYNPDKIQYNDRSAGLRKQSDQAANAQVANARALSGGLASNLRANATAARTANLDRQGGIDEREQARADAVTNANTEISNNAKQVNLGRKDAYQNQMMANRAAKTAYIDQAASDIGQYGQLKQQEGYLRSRDSRADAAQLAGLNAMNNTSRFKYSTNGDSRFENEESNATSNKYSASPLFPLPQTNTRSRKKLGYNKGTKSIKTK